MPRGGVLESTDVIVANSEFTADNFRKKDATFVVNNIVDPALFKLNNPVDPRSIHVAMISSNQPKKGLFDFVDLARVLAEDTRIRMVLTGPDNAHIQELKNHGSLPENIVFSGYAPSPSEALARANMVLNLSNFEETFGRTVRLQLGGSAGADRTRGNRVSGALQTYRSRSRADQVFVRQPGTDYLDGCYGPDEGPQLQYTDHEAPAANRL